MFKEAGRDLRRVYIYIYHELKILGKAGNCGKFLLVMGRHTRHMHLFLKHHERIFCFWLSFNKYPLCFFSFF